jgi:hypothetical protein
MDCVDGVALFQWPMTSSSLLLKIYFLGVSEQFLPAQILVELL